MPPRLLQVRTGQPAPLGDRLTAYARAPRDGPVRATALGLEGDAVGNPRVHGGPEKAVYACAAAHYPRWIADHPGHAARLVPGAFGENLLVEGLDETSVCIGDCWRVGTALLQPCQPRQPCSTLARWFDDPAMVRAMVRNGRSGWYCRVLEEGALAAGDPWILERRPPGAITIAQVLAISYRRPPDRAELATLAAAPGLAASWAAWAAAAAMADRPAPKPL